MLMIEEILDHAARRLGLSVEQVREKNFYREGQTTHYGQVVKDAARIPTIWNRLKESSDFASRRAEIAAFNAQSIHRKRGLAITPVKFGISFTATFFNQGEALVLIYRDGSVQVNHGGTEMGQGLNTKVQQIAAETLGVPISSIRMMPTRTDKLPNTSATAASAGTDLTGAAVVDACTQIGAPRQLRRRCSIARTSIRITAARHFSDGSARKPRQDSFLRQTLRSRRIRSAPSASFAQGYYRTPGIHFDAQTSSGKPFHYFAYGAAVSEVEIESFTGDCRLLRTDILEDVGSSVSPLIDRGQIEGGFLQSVSVDWLTDQKGFIETRKAVSPPEAHPHISCLRGLRSPKFST